MREIVDVAKLLWEWLSRVSDWSSLESWFARAAIALLSILAIFYALKTLAEWSLQLKSSLENLGLRPGGLTPEQKTKLRRRRQFCEVLRSDLATLAKAEAWNDQFFTDLEAQIEAEGRFYASHLDRTLRRRSTGLRRVRSLIRAIETSAEQFLLLIGEAGSGKSVALRHLANQLASRAARSTADNVPIPLYVNLKELPSAPPEGPNADFIKRFVLDNIRRGDVDTADYVRENWDEYRERGVWFFLFDSFDEIPEILHAPSGSHSIQRYTESIRLFLATMSACRGVVASREFKGPELLPWHRLRILPLSPQRQEELIDNTFLPHEKKKIVAQYLATQESHLRHHPLFLSLLCRHVKEVGRGPHGDLDLLDNHIDRLAERDPAFVSSTYGLDSQQLIAGAIYLARLFAETPQFSLAPTLDEISRVSRIEEIPGGNLENLLAALVYVKLGRSDVQSTRAGEKKFTFAHRRYQESLFVRHLTRRPAYPSSTELLTDPRWREYAVTLLQTQQRNDISPLLVEASRLLGHYQAQAVATPVAPEFGASLHYYEWAGDPAVSLLTLLQEGLSRRVSDVPAELREQVDALLTPRWERGDFQDRENVLRICGLLPEPRLISLLLEAIEEGTPDMLGLAFQKTTYLSHLPEKLAEWTRLHLSNSLLEAPRREDVLKLDALSARLPDSTGAAFVFERSMQLRKTLAWKVAARTHQLMSTVVSVLLKTNVALSDFITPPDRGFNPGFFALFLSYQMSLGIALFGIAFFVPKQQFLSELTGNLLVGTIGGLMIAVSALQVIRYANRGVGQKMTARVVVSFFSTRFDWRSPRSAFVSFVPPVFIACFFLANWLDLPQLVLGLNVVMASITLCLLMASTWLESKRVRTASESLKHWRANRCAMPLIMHAQTLAEAKLWIKKMPREVLPSPAYVRSFGAVVLARPSPPGLSVCSHGRPLSSLSQTPKSEVQRLGRVLMTVLRQTTGP